MIQRVQSLYLLIAGVLQVLFAFGTYFTYKTGGELRVMTGQGIFDESGNHLEGDVRTMVFALVGGVLSVATIFFFKDRKKQMKLISLLILFSLTQVVFLIWSYMAVQDAEELAYGWQLALIPVMLILYILARASVKKDDELVRSVDRIR